VGESLRASALHEGDKGPGRGDTGNPRLKNTDTVQMILGRLLLQ